SILQSKKSKYTKCKFNEMIKLIGNIDLIWILQLIYEIFRLNCSKFALSILTIPILNKTPTSLPNS
ncbi:MAG: hypothetical protein QG673_1875, partial [Pseudomonadota bacterium]|nr:hypothetical protein [Pseudomonadota bacterium]